MLEKLGKVWHLFQSFVTEFRKSVYYDERFKFRYVLILLGSCRRFQMDLWWFSSKGRLKLVVVCREWMDFASLCVERWFIRQLETLIDLHVWCWTVCSKETLCLFLLQGGAGSWIRYMFRFLNRKRAKTIHKIQESSDTQTQYGTKPSIMIAKSKSCVICLRPPKRMRLIFSKIWTVEQSILLKIMLFLCFQISHVQESQIKCIMERRALEPPAILPNWIKWFEISVGSVLEISNQLRTRCQRDPKQLQCKNKWETVFGSPHPLTQSRESLWIIPRWIKLSLVVSLLRKSHYANTNTFKGTCLWQKRFRTDEVGPGA